MSLSKSKSPFLDIYRLSSYIIGDVLIIYGTQATRCNYIHFISKYLFQIFYQFEKFQSERLSEFYIDIYVTIIILVPADVGAKNSNFFDLISSLQIFLSTLQNSFYILYISHDD